MIKLDTMPKRIKKAVPLNINLVSGSMTSIKTRKVKYSYSGRHGDKLEELIISGTVQGYALQRRALAIQMDYLSLKQAYLYR